jgi:hypothetical protein
VAPANLYLLHGLDPQKDPELVELVNGEDLERLHHQGMYAMHIPATDQAQFQYSQGVAVRGIHDLPP